MPSLMFKLYRFYTVLFYSDPVVPTERREAASPTPAQEKFTPAPWITYEIRYTTHHGDRVARGLVHYTKEARIRLDLGDNASFQEIILPQPAPPPVPGTVLPTFFLDLTGPLNAKSQQSGVEVVVIDVDKAEKQDGDSQRTSPGHVSGPCSCHDSATGSPEGACDTQSRRIIGSGRVRYCTEHHSLHVLPPPASESPTERRPINVPYSNPHKFDWSVLPSCPKHNDIVRSRKYTAVDEIYQQSKEELRKEQHRKMCDNLARTPPLRLRGEALRLAQADLIAERKWADKEESRQWQRAQEAAGRQSRWLRRMKENNGFAPPQEATPREPRESMSEDGCSGISDMSDMSDMVMEEDLPLDPEQEAMRLQCIQDAQRNFLAQQPPQVDQRDESRQIALEQQAYMANQAFLEEQAREELRRRPVQPPVGGSLLSQSLQAAKANDLERKGLRRQHLNLPSRIAGERITVAPARPPRAPLRSRLPPLEPPADIMLITEADDDDECAMESC